jgi:cell division protein FtsB
MNWMGGDMFEDGDHRRKVLSARLAQVCVLLDQTLRRIQLLAESVGDQEPADLQGPERRLQHLQSRRLSLQDEIEDLDDQLNRFELGVLLPE